MRPLPATSAKTLSDIQILLRLWPFVRPYGWRLLGGVAAVLIGAAAMVSIPQLVRVLVDDALNQRNAASLNYAVLAIMLVVVALVATTYIRAYLLRISGLRISIDVRTALFKHLLSHPVSFFETRPSGELATRLSSDVNEIRIGETHCTIR
jgi:ATP-binding cassette subfamily B protein